jgi:hypothetical protein
MAFSSEFPLEGFLIFIEIGSRRKPEIQEPNNPETDKIF